MTSLHPARRVGRPHRDSLGTHLAVTISTSNRDATIFRNLMQLHSPTPPLPFKHARRGESGIPFIEYLDARAGHDRRTRSRQLAFLHEWEYLADRLGHSPAPKEYAERWNMPVSTAYDLLAEFRQLFPTERDPARLIDEIWNGVHAQQGSHGGFLDLDRVLVVPLPDSPATSDGR